MDRVFLFDPRRSTASPRHAQISGRYQALYALVDFFAAIAFVIGSIFFFYDSFALAADWLFLAGSILFAVRPTVTVVGQFHLSRIRAPSDYAVDSGGGVPG